MNININIKKLNERAVIPTRGSEYAAGYDLYALNGDTIAPGVTSKISTGIALEVPEGFFGAIFARSGLATKQGLRPANCVGVIDSDYRGEVIVALHNDSQEDSEVCAGDRIAQLVIVPFLPVEFTEVDELSDTARGTGGFGSTGVSTLTTEKWEQLNLFDHLYKPSDTVYTLTTD